MRLAPVSRAGGAVVTIGVYDGVHLGQDDIPPAEARRLLGADAVIGDLWAQLGALDVIEARVATVIEAAPRATRPSVRMPVGLPFTSTSLIVFMPPSK
mgnify:CR=1 FL=1